MRHVEYIHYNPVKHGLAASPKEWAHSSFHRFVREGKYPLDWGSGVEMVFDSTIGAE
jgi:putative transposase